MQSIIFEIVIWPKNAEYDVKNSVMFWCRMNKFVFTNTHINIL